MLECKLCKTKKCDKIILVNGCKHCLQNVCKWEYIYSNDNTINTINTNDSSPWITWNNSNTINTTNTIYTDYYITCGSGKKYKQCCGK